MPVWLQFVLTVAATLTTGAVSFAAVQIWKQRLKMLGLEMRMTAVEKTCAERWACIVDIKTDVQRTARNVVRLGMKVGVEGLEDME